MAVWAAPCGSISQNGSVTTSAAPDESASLAALDITDSATWPEFMTTDEVSYVLRLSKQTVLAAIAKGFIPERGWASSKRVAKRDLLDALPDGKHINEETIEK